MASSTWTRRASACRVSSGTNGSFVLGSGWFYRQGFNIEQLEKQQDSDTIAQYLDTVDEVLFGGSKGRGVREWASERDRVDRREKLEREARKKSRKLSVSFLDSNGALVGVRTCRERQLRPCFDRRVALADVLGAMQNLAVTEEPEGLQSSQNNMIASASATTFHGGRSAARSRTVSSRAHTRSSSRCSLPPSCPTCSPD
jgi:hypothetical protein